MYYSLIGVTTEQNVAYTKWWYIAFKKRAWVTMDMDFAVHGVDDGVTRLTSPQWILVRILQ